MWVSTRAQYGMRALVEVALAGATPVSLKTIAQRQDLSQQYLEQIFSHLRRAGIVESIRGAHGGYRLARPTDQIDSLEVVELLAERHGGRMWATSRAGEGSTFFIELPAPTGRDLDAPA